MGGYIGINNIKGVNSCGDQQRKFLVALKKTLGTNKSVIGYSLGAIGPCEFVIGKSGKTSFINRPVSFVFFIVIQIKIDPNTKTGINQGNFPVFAVVGLS